MQNESLVALWGEGVPVSDKELFDRRKRVGGLISDWFAEFEKK